MAKIVKKAVVTKAAPKKSVAPMKKMTSKSMSSADFKKNIAKSDSAVMSKINKNNSKIDSLNRVAGSMDFPRGKSGELSRQSAIKKMEKSSDSLKSANNSLSKQLMGGKKAELKVMSKVK